MVTGEISYIIYLIIDIISVAIYLRIIADLKNVRGGAFAGNNTESTVKRKIFLVMCSLALLEGTVSVINDVLYFTMDILGDFADNLFLQFLQILDYFLSESACTVLTLLWMLFVDYCVYKSPGHIKKRYFSYYVMAGIGILFSAVSSCFTIKSLSEPALWAVVTMIIDTFVVLPVIQLIFVVTAYTIVAGYRKERRPPLFLRLDVFIVPVAIGCVLGVVIHESLRSLGFAIGLLLTLRIQRNRSRYIDPDTDFYNKDFLQLMYEHMEKNGYLKEIGIIFSAPDRKDELLRAVGQLNYDNSEVFLLDDGKVLLTTEEQKKEAVELIIRFVSSVAQEADPPFEISADTIERKEGESAGSFTARIIETADRLA